MIIKEEKKIDYCSQCPFCEAKRIHTADSFEHVYELFCKKLNESVHMLEWNEKGKCDTPPTKCPFNKETTDLKPSKVTKRIKEILQNLSRLVIICEIFFRLIRLLSMLFKNTIMAYSMNRSSKISLETRRYKKGLTR